MTESSLADLKQRIQSLEAELRALSGKLGNRAPEQALELEKRNQDLIAQLEELETSLFQLLIGQLKPRHSDEAAQQAEVLRLATVEYCRQSQINPELWKNIEF